MKTTETLIAEFNKEFGGEVVIPASRLPRTVGRIPTGALAVDVATGGGWPRGHWTEVTGIESSGKTALCFLTVAAAQAADPNHVTVWIAAEEFVPSWAEACGVDLDRLYLVNTNVAEKALDTALGFMENRACDLVVIDSLPALVPDEENAKDMDEPQVALQARLFSKFFRKANFAMHRMAEEDRPCTGIAINQFRAAIGGWQRFGEPTTTPGGKAKNYYFFVRAEITRKDWLGTKDEKWGQRVRVLINKNKTAPSQRTAEFNFYFADHDDFTAGSVDVADQVISLGVAYGIISRRGAFYYVGEDSFQGLDKVLAKVRTNSTLYASIRDQVLAASAGHVRTEATIAKRVRRRA